MAARLKWMSYVKDTVFKRGYSYCADNFLQHVKSQVQAGVYTNKLTSMYTEDELVEASSFINLNNDLLYDYAGTALYINRYLLPNELIQEAYLVLALMLASKEKNQIRLAYVKKFYEAVSCKKISLATPILLNLRTPEGNLSSCFVASIGDSIHEIFDTVKDTALISKNGGGVGLCISEVRSKGSSIRGELNKSNGVLPWIKVINDTAVACNQLGKRAGAVTVALDCWHFDTPEFLDIQIEHGDIRQKSFDIFPQIVLSDNFMRRVEANQPWLLLDPHEVYTKTGHKIWTLWGADFDKVYEDIFYTVCDDPTWLNTYKIVSAKKLLIQIMQTRVETGLPYITFKDTLNKYNPNKHVGYIPSFNLCTESTSNVEKNKLVHCCNLVSLNLSNLEFSDFDFITSIATRILDNTIDLTTTPIPEAAEHNNAYRTIGIGVLGLADFIAKHNENYYTADKLISQTFETLAYYGIHHNMRLAKERGAYEYFPNSEWAKGNLIGRPIESIEQAKNSNKAYDTAFEITTQDWKKLRTKVMKYGVRNSQMFAIAPNTSSSIIQGCAASILPHFSLQYIDKNSKGSVSIFPPLLKTKKWFYTENKNFDQNKLVHIVGNLIQPWIDTGVSMEILYNLNNPEIDALYMYNVIIKAWMSECKAIYYERSLQVNTDDLLEAECTSCAN